MKLHEDADRGVQPPHKAVDGVFWVHLWNFQEQAFEVIGINFDKGALPDILGAVSGRALRINPLEGGWVHEETSMKPSKPSYGLVTMFVWTWALGLRSRKLLFGVVLLVLSSRSAICQSHAGACRSQWSGNC